MGGKNAFSTESKKKMVRVENIKEDFREKSECQAMVHINVWCGEVA